jgi:signal transduction histidine kinase
MDTGRLPLRLFVALLVAVLPPVVLVYFLAPLIPEFVTQLGTGTALLLTVLWAVLWIALIAILAGPLISEEARSMADIAERGTVATNDADTTPSAAQRRLSTALDERNRQIEALASWAGSVQHQPAADVATAAVRAVRSVMGDPTWVLAIHRGTSPALLAEGIYEGEQPEPTGPIDDLHRWAATLGDGTEDPARLAEGPWGAFVTVRVGGDDQYAGTLMAPWEGRVAPSPAELTLLTLVGQHVSAALDHSVLYAQLRSQAEELTRMQMIQRDFLRGVSHDLQTPLTRISALAAEVAATPVNPQAKQDLDAVRHQADRLRRMVAQLLVVSRLEAGALGARQEIVKPVELLRAVWEVLAPPDAQLTVDATSSALAIADPDRLEQVLWALLDNAVKYSPGERIVRVTYKSRSRHAGGDQLLQPSAPASDLVAVLTISDSGIGMDASTAERATDQFYRAEGARRLVPDGSGVGLYAARGLVELMGGRLNLRSRLGVGTSVTITLPAETAMGAGEPPAPINGDAASGLRQARPT